MGKLSQRLGREDWILAGLRALVRGGQGALRVEPVAREIGASKGSFYWHFSDPVDWHRAMLGYWEEHAFSGIVAALEAVTPGEARLRAVIGISVAQRDPGYGGALAEPALRDWARYAPAVAEAVRRVDGARIGWVQQELAAAGANAAGARVLYAALVGAAALHLSAAETEEDLLSLLSLLLRDASGGRALAE